MLTEDTPTVAVLLVLDAPLQEYEIPDGVVVFVHDPEPSLYWAVTVAVNVQLLVSNAVLLEPPLRLTSNLYILVIFPILIVFDCVW